MSIKTLYQLCIQVRFAQYAAALVFVAGIAVALPIFAADEPRRPNIVLIVADDLGYGDLGCYGQRDIQTPHLDKLASEGMRFTQAYAGATVCAPSRCVLMTGLHQGHCRVRGNAGGVRQALREDDVTIAQLLNRAGYATGLVGKWGLGDIDGGAEVGLPNRHGFDYFFGYLNQVHAHNYYPSFLWRNDRRVKLRNTVPNERPSGAGVSNDKLEYSTDLFAEESLKFIREHQKQPFFLYLAVTTPHANNEAGNEGMEVPDYGMYANRDWPAPRKGHAAMITRLDSQVGRLMLLLDELNLADNTLLIFTSDNGPHAEGGYHPAMNQSSGGLRGHKRAPYEGGIRVPLIVRWPGVVAADETSNAICHFCDFLPTLAQVAGAATPANLDGVSLLPTLRGAAQPELQDRLLYWEFNENDCWQAARQGRWKIVYYPTRDKVELYDLDADPAESKNLADAHPDIAAKLQSRLTKARSANPDWPLPNNPQSK